VADLIGRLRCRVIVVSRNRLGTINHTLLTVAALQSMGVRELSVVLMDGAASDASSASNALVLAECLKGVPVNRVGFLGSHPMQSMEGKQVERKLEKVLARILGSGKVPPRSLRVDGFGVEKKVKIVFDNRAETNRLLGVAVTRRR
jgi:hypothetical protein